MIPISPTPASPNDFEPFALDMPRAPNSSGERQALREAADAFEAVFLTEMLSHAGMGASGSGIGDGGFDGGKGGDAFASMLTREWATRLSSQGGLGLSDAIYRSLVARETSNA